LQIAFGCEPFQPMTEKPLIPFYFCYRDFDRLVPSCFGGEENPPSVNGPNKSGVWFMLENDEWQLYEWKEDQCGGGIVITIRHGDSMTMALFGLSGRSTNAICNEIIVHPQKFWAGNDEHKTGTAKRSHQK
jgi:hypothetical protein